MKTFAHIVLAAALFIGALLITSCNVTRTITTTSQCYQRGDTSVLIQTKTTEIYDGTIKR